MKKILVVDDDPSIVMLITKVLTRGNYRVFQAASGQQARQQISATRPDLVVLDVMMPDFNGFEVCRGLKGDDKTKDIKVILVTAKTSGKDIQTGLSAGADCYMTKPFKIAELSARIKQLLESEEPGAAGPKP